MLETPAGATVPKSYTGDDGEAQQIPECGSSGDGAIKGVRHGREEFFIIAGALDECSIGACALKYWFRASSE